MTLYEQMIECEKMTLDIKSKNKTVFYESPEYNSEYVSSLFIDKVEQEQITEI